MRKLIAMLVALTMLSSSIIPAFAVTLEVDTASMTKAEFADYCDSLAATTRAIPSILSKEDALKLMDLYSRSSGMERLAYEQQLNQGGYYIYSDGSEDGQVTPCSQPGDVSLGTVVVTYIPYTQEWVLGYSGRWLNMGPISEEMSGWVTPYVGSRENIGGYDAAGIILYNTSGATPNMVHTQCIVYDQDSSHSYSSTSPSTYNSREGSAFQYQDYVQVDYFDVVSGNYSYFYLGYVFTVAMTFDSSFAQFNGKARGFYVHTWDTTSITSIGFDVGVGSFGLNVAWVNQGHSFQIYSNADTTF